MKILHLQKQDLDETAVKIVEAHKKDHDVTVLDLRQNRNYDEIVDLVFSSDKVISW